jgi:hypothetical protein
LKKIKPGRLIETVRLAVEDLRFDIFGKKGWIVLQDLANYDIFIVKYINLQ